MKKLRFAVVGCGVIAPSHIEAIASHDNSEVACLCDIIPERAAAMAEKYA
ncbi:MAG: Gfo/Idh/MocA family oxidoreductase, partial [Victivallales bacterium]|nr:Gfo/Idh/MocA family oxidoreductase [Victivallales bacterium]